MIGGKPSLQKPQLEHFTGDPALEQPPEAPPDGATAEELKAHATAVELYAQKLTRARETADWSALTLPGQEPTGFSMGMLPAQALALLTDMKNGENWNEILMLAFRISLRAVTNLGGIKVELEHHRRFGKIASTSFFDRAGVAPGLAVKIMIELGGVALERASRLSPKS